MLSTLLPQIPNKVNYCRYIYRQLIVQSRHSRFICAQEIFFLLLLYLLWACKSHCFYRLYGIDNLLLMSCHRLVAPNPQQPQKFNNQAH